MSYDFQLGTNRLLVKQKQTYWLFNGRHRTVVSTDESRDAKIAATNLILQSIKASEVPLHSLLSLGPHRVPPGSVRWTGDRFAYTAQVFSAKWAIDVNIASDRDGYANRMDFTIVGPSVDGRYSAQYQFDRNNRGSLPPYFPNRIETQLQGLEGLRADKVITVLSMRLADELTLPPNAPPFLWPSLRHFKSTIFTNGEMYRLTPAGEYQLLPRPEVHRTPQALAYANRYYYTVSGSFSLLCILAGLLLRRTELNGTKTN